MTDKIKQFYDAAIEKLDEIDALMLPGAKLTLIIRRPGDIGTDILITGDDPAELVALIERRFGPKARPDTKVVMERFDA